MAAPVYFHREHEPHEANVYAVGRAGEVYEMYYRLADGRWYGWQPMGPPPGGCTSAPDAASTDGYHLFLFCRGVDGAMYRKMWNGGTWGSWYTMYDNWTNGPGPTDYYQPGDGWHLNLYAINEMGHLYENYWRYATGNWSGWVTDLGAPCAHSADGGYVYSGTHDLYVACRWKNIETSPGVFDGGKIMYRKWNGSGPWSVWYDLQRR